MSTATRRREQEDAYATQFEARGLERGAWDGRLAVTAPESWFYPESGGQLGDVGSIGAVRVLDTQVDDDGRVWHVVDDDPGPGPLPAAVEWARRFDHMQQHTGQHILSAAFERELGAATLSSTLGAERSVIEVALPDTDWRMVERVEAAVHRVLWEDRPVQVHWTDATGLDRFPLRKPPKVQGRIRIVEVTDWDWSACGGTHTRRTGEVGVVKVTGWERVRGNLRFSFLCGGRAVRDHAWRTEAMLEAARRHTRGERELITHLERAVAERDTLRKRVTELEHHLLLDDLRGRLGSPVGPLEDLAEHRPREENQALARAAIEVGAPWVVATTLGPEPQLVLARARGVDLDLRTLQPELIAASGGRGGGRPDLLTVTATDGAMVRAAHALACATLRASAPGT